MARIKSSARSYRRTSGVAVCIHTCVDGGCRNSAQSILWARNGNPLRKHAASSLKHPACAPPCPGHAAIGMKKGYYVFCRAATQEDTTDNEKSNLGSDEINLPIVTDGAPQPGCPQNDWIIPLFVRWNDIPFLHMPFSRPGLEVLQHLISYRHPIPIYDTPASVATSTNPRINHIITDLLNLRPDQYNTIDCYDYAQQENVTLQPIEIISSFIESQLARDWDTNDLRRHIGCLSIPASQQGLRACCLCPSSELRENTIFASDNDDMEFLSALVPAGAVSAPHIDYHGASQLMYHISGEKLWLMWPPTNGNMEWINKRRDGIPEGNSTVQAIQELEDMKILYTTDIQTAFILPPYCIHAVLTFTPSSHSGTRMWSYDSFDLAMKALDMDIHWGSNPIEFGLSNEDGINTLLEILEESKQWRKLAKKHRAHPLSRRVKIEVGQKEMWVKNVIQKLERAATR